MKEMKRILSLFLCLVMLVGYIPVGALAADGDDATEPTEGAVVETTVPETTVPETTVPETTVPETTEPADKPAPKPVRKPVSMGMMGTTVSKKEAAGEVKVASRANDSMLTAAIFFGDVRGNTAVMKSVLTTIGGNGVSYETIGLVGNTAGAMADVTAAAKAALGQTAEVYYAWGSQDAQSDISDDSALLYSGDHYYIYHISDADMRAEAGAEAEAVSAEIAEFKSAVESMDKTKVLFVMSHAPLHDSLDDNTYANEWYTAVAEAAAKMDVVFFWAHNHAGESAADTAAYYVAKSGAETMTIEGGSEVVPNFTYMNAGYLNADAQRKGVATTVEIYEDTLVFQEYTATGEYQDANHAHNVTVERAFTEEQPEETTAPSEPEATTAPTAPSEPEESVPAESEPALVDLKVTYSKQTLLGDEMVLSVEAVYEDGTTKALTNAEYQLATNYTRDIAAVQVYVVSYGEQSHAFLIGRDAATNVSVVADEMEALTVVDVTADEAVIAAVADTFTGAFAAYDITPDQYNTDNSPAVVSMPAPEGSNAVYYWNQETNELEPVADAAFEDGMVVFTTSHFSIYTVGDSTKVDVPPGSTATQTTKTKEVYVYVPNFDGKGDYLISNANTARTDGNLLTATSSGTGNTANVVITTGKTASGEEITYIEDPQNNSAVWNAKASGDGFTLRDKGLNRYLIAGWNGNYYISTGTSDDTPWRSNTDSVYYKHTLATSYVTYYANSTTSLWTRASSEQTVYLYKKQTVTFDMAASASIKGDPEKQTVAVADGTTMNLKSILTVYANGASKEATIDPAKLSYEIYMGKDTSGNTVNGDPNDIIKGIDGSTVTFTGNTGSALILISYKSDYGTVTNFINLTACKYYYTAKITKDGEDVTNQTVPVKSVTADTTLDLNSEVTRTDASITSTPAGTWEWNIPEEYQSIATVNENGVVDFSGKEGLFYVTATFKDSDTNEQITVQVYITASAGSYTTPDDGVGDFPEYPNEGAIRYDKTATAVGNFSETGIAQMELAMTGVNYTKGNEIDVVIMMDMSSSMKSTQVTAAQNAANAALEAIVKKDDKFNNNRVAVYTFNGWSDDDEYSTKYIENIYGDDHNYNIKQLLPMQTYDSNSLTAAKNTISGADATGAGTNYAAALKQCYTTLANTKTEGRKQYVIFLSDGLPTTGFAYVNGNGKSLYTNSNLGDNGTTIASTVAQKDEYYSRQMKNAGVTIYSVSLYINNTYGQTILENIAGTSTEKGSDGNYAYHVKTGESEDKLSDIFKNIVSQIMQAATDVTVEDQIADEYTMIFDIPTGTNTITGVTNNDFYIEFGKYALDDDHERTTFTSESKLYLKKTGNVLSAAKDAAGTAYDAPTFDDEPIGDKGTLYYWTSDSSYAAKAAVTYTSGGTTYYFIPTGMKADAKGYDATKWFNLRTGAYAHGTVNTTTNTSSDLVIITPYFVYNAHQQIGTGENNTPVYGQMLYWTVDKLDEMEYVLRYFVYLKNSATEVGVTGKEAAPGPYATNEYAFLTYTNFNGTECRQKFPEPQMTWNGAQVAYTFYLVNAAGEPINRAGQKVDFANATYVTDVFRKSVVWNKGLDGSTGTGELSADWLAADLLPKDYKIYDEKSGYELHVYEKADGTVIKNQFTIEGDTPANISTSLNNRLNLGTSENSVSDETTKVFNNKAGKKYSRPDTYYSTDKEMLGFDFANTTVAFAVVWAPSLTPDTVVVDYGLDVEIDVIKNDILQSKIQGISATGYSTGALNTGVAGEKQFEDTAQLNINGHIIEKKTDSLIRFNFCPNDMEFREPVSFFYEVPVNYWQNGKEQSGFLHSKVTVVPATTVYYEDSFVRLSTGKSAAAVDDEESNIGKWVDAGTAVNNATQAQDRPGPQQFFKDLDADNVYGYDSAYDNMSTYSMGSAKKITVDKDHWGYAEFTFYGTGFDLISMTSNNTGTITVLVKNEKGEKVRNTIVDTFYGMDKNGTVTTNAADILYQIPVIKVADLEYGKYSVKITAAYNTFFDHIDGSENYDFYLDAVRIYDPTGNKNTAANDIYKQDGEGWPVYQELRNNVIAAADFKAKEDVNGDAAKGTINGIAFIDTDNTTFDVTDYISYGPNNELYLAKDQMIVFGLDMDAYLDLVDRVNLGMKSANGASLNYAIVDADTVLKNAEPAVAAQIKAIEDAAVQGKTTDAEKLAAKDAAMVSLLKSKYQVTEEAIAAAKQEAIDALKANDADGVVSEAEENEAAYEAVQSMAAKKLYWSEFASLPTKQISTSTDMYYDITDVLFETKKVEDEDVRVYKNPVIIIRNAGDGILSLTNIKVTFTDDPGEVKKLFYVDYETIMKELLDPEITLESEYGEDKDYTTEGTDLDMTISAPEYVIEGEPFKVTVVTTKPVNSVELKSSNIAGDITMVANPARTKWVAEVTLYEPGSNVEITAVAEYGDGSKIEATAATLVKPKVEVQLPAVVLAGDEYTVTIKAKAGTQIAVKRGDKPVDSKDINMPDTSTWTCNFVAGNVDEDVILVEATSGDVTTTVEAIVNISSVTVEVTPNGAVKTGQTVTFKVTTDDEINLVTIYGEPVTTYRTMNGSRIWTAKYSWDEPNADGYAVDVILSHVDGYELDPIEKVVVVTTPASTVIQYVKNAVMQVANTILSWFGW